MIQNSRVKQLSTLEISSDGEKSCHSSRKRESILAMLGVTCRISRRRPRRWHENILQAAQLAEQPLLSQAPLFLVPLSAGKLLTGHLVIGSNCCPPVSSAYP